MSNCPIVVHEEVNEIVFGLIEKIWIYVSNKLFLLVEISGVTSSAGEAVWTYFDTGLAINLPCVMKQCGDN